MEDKYQRVIKVYYTALMTFLVFTFAQKLLTECIGGFCMNNLLYVIMWLSMVVQTTFAYVHIRNIENYSKWALVSDCIDVLAELYVCVAIMCIYNGDICNFMHLSIPFMIIEINQFVWFVLVREFNPAAVARIGLLFSGMLGVTISEAVNHCQGNLYAIVALMVLICVLRAINKVPQCIADLITKIWHNVKRYKNKLKNKSKC